ncbi:GON-4-like protein isoform X2 [Genypterus blacodes]
MDDRICVRTDVWTPTASTPCKGGMSGGGMMGEEAVTMDTSESSEDELGRLDIDLGKKSKQHNLTSSNVRAILHEVITHECVVAMMKATIRDTQDLPLFEPKMTRSRLRQAVQSLSCPSAVKGPLVKPSQFVDIELEEEEDSSDEEYCPDEEEEDETAEETFHSDADSLGSSPRMDGASQPTPPVDQKADDPMQREGSDSFLEKLQAVEEELNCSPTLAPYQVLKREGDHSGGVDNEGGALAYRTRSKRPLVNIPLGQLEAELLAPDITADMYDESSALLEEDRHWSRWLQGLLAPETEEEADDEDDPEYNILEDLDEPDLEDYRTDRAVQITKKEVNELLEELFDTFQEVMTADQQRQEEEESQSLPKFNVPQALRFEAPLANMLTERRQTVRKQYEALQQKRALQDTPTYHHDNGQLKSTLSHQFSAPTFLFPTRVSTFHLNHGHKLQLQQQIQQHVQLLTQVHLLTRRVSALNHEACITKQYLEELQEFARRQEQISFSSSFRVCNLQAALDVLQEDQNPEEAPAPPVPPAARRWLPNMSPATNSLAFPVLPADAAWLFATRSVFLYPELLPVCSLDPALYPPRHRMMYTGGEDGLIVLGLKHFEGTVEPHRLISTYLLCKRQQDFRKHIREMSSPKAPPGNIIKVFLQQGGVPPLPVACSRVLSGEQRPPVQRNICLLPNWLKKSQLVIQSTRLPPGGPLPYPASLPRSCSLRLHPAPPNMSKPTTQRTRLLRLAHTASLPPLAKAPAHTQADRQVNTQSDRQVTRRTAGQLINCLSQSPASFLSLGASTQSLPAVLPLDGVLAGPAHMQSCLPIDQKIPTCVTQHSVVRPPVLLPDSSLSHPNTPNPIMPCSAAKPSFILLWTPTASPSRVTQHAPLAAGRSSRKMRKQQTEMITKTPYLENDAQEERGRSVRTVGEDETEEEEEEEGSTSVSTLSSPSSCPRGEEEERNMQAIISLNGGENSGGEEQEVREGGGRGGEEEPKGQREEEGRGEREDGQSGGEDRGEREDGQSGGEREDDGEKDKGEEEEEEDFDELTQDEDEEEGMSSASEDSVLSVPELQETMKQLSWLASERRLCGDSVDSEEDHSPTSPGSQEEEEEEEEEEPGEGRSTKDTPTGEGAPRGGGRGPGRGRGRSRPPRALRRSRQERHSKDTSKLLLLYDDNILDNDPLRDSKDVAFAQSYLSRVREALQDIPAKAEAFVSLLSEFEKAEEGQAVAMLFRKMRNMLGGRTDLLRDFAAFLHPDQALECGLFEEQQAFERSRRFLRQLEISFGDNPSHYQKIIKALQAGPDLNPASIQELKAQMDTLLKGHTHLQAEFWVFFDELRPPPARPGQFEEAHWPEEGGGGSEGGEGLSLGGAGSSGFEEVTLPELEEEEEGHKIQPMESRRQRRKIGSHGNYKDCEWSDKDWPCLCHDAKIRRHRRKPCSRCHGNKSSRAMKSLDPLYAQSGSAHHQHGDKEGDADLKGDDDSPQRTDHGVTSWEVSFHVNEEKEEEEEEEDDDEKMSTVKDQIPAGSDPLKRIRTEKETLYPPISTSFTSSAPLPPRPSPPPDFPVCAKNISLTPSGQKVILWTREADRVILTTCQQEGANQSTFQAISSLLGNKTPTEVSRRFRDLMRLFRTAARHAGSEEEAPPSVQSAANEEGTDMDQ